jgi:hypothetical protein
MHWRPEATTSTDGKTSSIPLDPHGMSGSFVWNTRLAEFTGRDETWTPGVARLTGIVWGWDTSDRLRSRFASHPQCRACLASSSDGKLPQACSRFSSCPVFRQPAVVGDPGGSLFPVGREQ